MTLLRRMMLDAGKFWRLLLGAWLAGYVLLNLFQLVCVAIVWSDAEPSGAMPWIAAADLAHMIAAVAGALWLVFAFAAGVIATVVWLARKLRGANPVPLLVLTTLLTVGTFFLTHAAARTWQSHKLKLAAERGLEALVKIEQAATQTSSVADMTSAAAFARTLSPGIKGASAYHLDVLADGSWSLTAHVPSHFCSNGLVTYFSRPSMDRPQGEPLSHGWYFLCH